MSKVIRQDIKIEDMIYEIRGKQVMLDSDLAKLYNIETKSLKRQVNRNKERFPMVFCFKLTKEEYYKILRRQNGTLELEQGKYSKYLPYVFTEQGVAMLSGVLRSETAINVSVKIINAFVAMRHFIKSNLVNQKYDKQYSNLSVIYNNTFHDRYFIIDNDIIYHCGASINRIGYKTFSINLISDKDIKELLINRIKTII